MEFGDESNDDREVSGGDENTAPVAPASVNLPVLYQPGIFPGFEDLAWRSQKERLDKFHEEEVGEPTKSEAQWVGEDKLVSKRKWRKWLS